MVAGLVDLGIKPSGVRGPRDTAEAFAAAWCAATGGVGAVSLQERLYRLNTLVKPAGVEGHAHAAGPSDFDVLTEWLMRFGSEAFGEHLDQAASARSVQAAKGLGDEYLLWTVQDRRVSMAAVRSPVAGVSRIGPVYTPTAERGRGYGSAVTAAAALWGRQHGADDVVLFADVANPTSNHIYQRIGFQLVSDYARINFDSPG
ncbi:MAG: GNAT family N-acetyltransferase [Mycolicibacterium sp.]|nr:GNAT family N-acetyltransferase [Mycolicibacterium sp.]